jgi:hypothetical protein
MSYTKRRHRLRSRQQALGGLLDTAQAAVAVATDPCLGQVTSLALELHDMAAASSPGSSTSAGVGLCGAVTPLTAVVWVKKNPWSAVAVSVAIIGGLIGLGYSMAGGNRT